MIAIVDYGMGNLRSVEKAFNRLNAEIIVSSSSEEILKANKLVLPGVGHFKKGMSNLIDLGLVDALNKKVLEEKTPVLGICLGMQLFTRSSEEGLCEGLGWIDAETLHFDFENRGLKVPHIGWNTLQNLTSNALLNGINETDAFYFVHSYYVKCKNQENCVSRTSYGIDFDSVIQKENIIGTQFHPEKSHDAGIKIIQNFIEKY